MTRARARDAAASLSARAAERCEGALLSRARAQVIYCAIADFRAGSYDAGLFLDTIARAGHGGLSYNAVANVSRDANGDAYTVQCVRPASRKVRSEPVRVSEHRARARARSLEIKPGTTRRSRPSRPRAARSRAARA